MRRIFCFLVLALTLAGLAGCTHKNVKNPLANLGSKQPDKVLFDRAMDFMKHGRWDQSRLLLQTLINTYPDSEYIARAKLGVADSWYAEGGTTAWAQAENEYRDFITFFPNMTEASEAQMKIANIHFREMEKADRDFTHAKRAEEEYRTMLTQYPDSPLVPQAKARLREVEEVLAEREFLVGRFYYLRQAYVAAEARLQTVVDTYPLYSGADEALYMLGDCYEKQADSVRKMPLNGKFTETQKGELLASYVDRAAKAYDRILTRYPATDRVADAKARLEALHQPVPTATPEMVAQNKAEEASRSELSHYERLKLVLHKGPDMSAAAKVGEPPLTDPPVTSAPALVKQESADVISAMAGLPLPSRAAAAQPAEAAKSEAGPDNAQPASQPAGAGIDELTTLPSSGTSGHVDAETTGKSTPPGANEPPPTTQAPPPAPKQINEAAPTGSTAESDGKTEDKAKTDEKAKPNDAATSSSSKKKKKGLKKLIPF
jgi:outer membrane protein assembly factor BamD